jgi:transcriptional regulator with XRE-family HTH domain
MERKGENIAALVTRLRDEAGLTNEQLAETAGLRASTVEAIASGERMCPSDGMMMKLAIALPVTLGEFREASVADGCTGAGQQMVDDEPAIVLSDRATIARKELTRAREILEEAKGSADAAE